jgi:hypothetical protein
VVELARLFVNGNIRHLFRYGPGLEDPVSPRFCQTAELALADSMVLKVLTRHIRARDLQHLSGLSSRCHQHVDGL